MSVSLMCADRGDEVIVDDGSADLAKRVKEVTGGEMAYGATDAVTGDMTGGGNITAAFHPAVL